MRDRQGERRRSPILIRPPVMLDAKLRVQMRSDDHGRSHRRPARRGGGAGGAPLELYDRPANLFVASVLGSPAIFHRRASDRRGRVLPGTSASDGYAVARRRSAGLPSKGPRRDLQNDNHHQSSGVPRSAHAGQNIKKTVLLKVWRRRLPFDAPRTWGGSALLSPCRRQCRIS